MRTLKNLPLLLSLTASVATVPAFAGSPATDVWPKPQSVDIKGQLEFSASQLKLSSVKDFPVLVDAFKAQKMKPSGGVAIKTTTGKSARSILAAAKVAEVVGAYVLEVSPKRITIAAEDETGIYYATQTLAQMIETDGKLISCHVADWPDMAFRGSIEGFYGKPWEHARRLSQIEFYGKYKMNAYIYGPKDDPYSGFNSGHWRDPYPAGQAKQITELVKVSGANHVNFIWAMHPGSSIRWDDKNGDGIADDVIIAMEKLEAMYKLGVRSFAVFFDDIGGEGAKGEKQAEMLNYINREFIKKKPDVAPLLMCPTDYAGTHGSEYKKTLGEKLDKDVNIMWTGPSICSDIPSDSVKAVSQHWQRKPFIWWNWPVSDYCRNNLLLGRTYGLDKGNKGLLSGFASNPMDKPEASKIGLFSIANWAWNVDGFDSQASWEASFPLLFPELADSMFTFAKHNSDQGKNFHGYRREESVAISPAVEKALAHYRENQKLSKGDAAVLAKEFAEISAAAEKISSILPRTDPALWHEIEYWVKSFGELGKSGTAVLQLASGNGGNGASHMQLFSSIASAKAQQEHTFFDAQKQRHFEETFPSDKRWATGGKVATLVLSPMVEELFTAEWAKAYGKLAGEKSTSKLAAYKAFSSVPGLGNVEAERDGNFVSLRRILEVVKMQPDQHIGIELPEGVHANYIHVTLSDAEAAQACGIEVSSDAETWVKFNAKKDGGNIQNPLNVKDEIRFFRLVNHSSQAVEFRIEKFKFDVPEGSVSNSVAATTDGDPASFYTITEQQTFTGPAKAKTAYFVSDAQEGVISQQGNKLTVKPRAGVSVRLFEVIWR